MPAAREGGHLPITPALGGHDPNVSRKEPFSEGRPGRDDRCRTGKLGLTVLFEFSDIVSCARAERRTTFHLGAPSCSKALGPDPRPVLRVEIHWSPLGHTPRGPGDPEADVHPS